MTVLVVLGALVSLAGNLVAWGLMADAPDDSGWSVADQAAAPSDEPTRPPSEGPSGAPGGGPDEVFRYVALGDSFTAAPGVPEPSGEPSCGRSTHNYPHLVASQLPTVELVDRSCSGADTSHLTSGQYAGMAPQLGALTADTDLVTLSMGGNDFGLFVNLLVTCPRLRTSDPTGAPCSEATGAVSARSLNESIDQIGNRLRTAVTEIRARAPEAQIMLVGYPVLAPATGICPDRLPLANGDYAYVNRMGRRLHATIQRAAASTGASYVDIHSASQGHDICSDDPWVNDRTTDPGRALLYHPFVEEQAAVARLILAELD